MPNTCCGGLRWADWFGSSRFCRWRAIPVQLYTKGTCTETMNHLDLTLYLVSRLHQHGIFGDMSMSNTWWTPPEPVRFAELRCPSNVFSFSFSFFVSPTRGRCGSDESDTPAMKKKITNFDRWTHQYH